MPVEEVVSCSGTENFFLCAFGSRALVDLAVGCGHAYIDEIFIFPNYAGAGAGARVRDQLNFSDILR